MKGRKTEITTGSYSSTTNPNGVSEGSSNAEYKQTISGHHIYAMGDLTRSLITSFFYSQYHPFFQPFYPNITYTQVTYWNSISEDIERAYRPYFGRDHMVIRGNAHIYKGYGFNVRCVAPGWWWRNRNKKSIECVVELLQFHF